MYCEKCGSKLLKDDVFCGMCGATTPAKSPTLIVSDTPVKDNPKQSKSPKPKKSKKPLIISLSAVALVLIAAALVFVFVALPLISTKNELSDFFIVQDGDDLLIFEEIRNYDEGRIEYVIDDDDYGTLAAEDFMDEPVDVTLLIEDEDGDLTKTITITGLMVINTEEDDSIRWGDYENATTLYVYDPVGEVELSDITELNSVKSLFIDRCVNITDIDELSDMSNLQALSLSTIDIDDIDVLEDIESLNRLALINLPDLSDFDVLEDLKSLKSLQLSSLDIDNIDVIGEHDNLESLTLISMHDLTDVDGLADFPSLRKLKLNFLKGLIDINVLEDIDSLEHLSIINLASLTSIDVLEDISGLQELHLIDLPLVDEDDADDIIDTLEDDGVVVFSDDAEFGAIVEPTPEPEVVAAQENEAPAAASSDGYTIGYISDNLSIYNKLIRDAFVAIAEYEGHDVIVKQSDEDIQNELTNAQDLIDMGVDAIALVSADTKNSHRTVELANDAGIPIFFLYSTPSNTTDAHKIAGKVTDSYEMVGYRLGEWVAQNYPDAICVNIPGFFGQSKASKQTVGFDKALTDAGMQPAILLEGSDWQYDKSIQIANDLLDSGIDFDVVFTCNEYTYQGVNKVFKERGVTSKIIVSTNGHDDYWDDISRGDLSASSPNPPTLLADLCFQQVVAHLNGEDYLSSLKVIPSQIILPENLDAAISWDADLYLQGRINGDFEYDLNYYSSLEYDNRDLILDILRLTVEFMQEL